MTDQKPTGVFVRLPLSNEQIGKLLAPISTLDGRLLSIGTPVQTRELTVVTTLGTLRDPIPCVRHSDAQAQIAARDAEIGRLREALSGVRNAITSDLNAKSIICTVWAGPAETLVDYIDATLKGGVA